MKKAERRDRSGAVVEPVFHAPRRHRAAAGLAVGPRVFCPADHCASYLQSVAQAGAAPVTVADVIDPPEFGVKRVLIAKYGILSVDRVPLGHLKTALAPGLFNVFHREPSAAVRFRAPAPGPQPKPSAKRTKERAWPLLRLSRFEA